MSAAPTRSALPASGTCSPAGLASRRTSGPGRHARPASRRRWAAVGLTAALLPVPVALAGPTSSAMAAGKTSTRLASSAPAAVSYGSTALVGGRLRSTTGRPVPGALLEVQRNSGRSWRTVATARTSANGLGRARIRVTASQRVRVYFRGSATHHFSSSGVRIVSVRRAAPRATAAAPSSSFAARIMAEARRHRGKPYRWGGNGPHSFDCSGFVKYVFARNGKSLPRTSAQQQRATARVSVNSKRVGDLVFTWTRGRVTHVGIYAGGNRMWAAPRTGDVVKLQSIYSRSISVGRVR